MTGPPLQQPAARQGPGPIPRKLLEALDLVVARRAAGPLSGDRRAAGIGAGTELAQLRPYEVGDDVRQIDPAATARTGQPYVRLHVPERTLTTWIVHDLSPSMAFGTARRLKSDVAEGAALVVGRLAVRRAGRVALLTFGAGKPRLMPPRASKPGLVAVERTLGEGVAADGHRDPAALAHALVRVGKVANQPGLIVVISDFRDQDPPGRGRSARCARATRCWRSRCATRARPTLPAAGRLALIDPETGERIEVDTGGAPCASASSRSRPRAARRWRASCAGCASSTWCSRPRATGCASSAGGCGELRPPLFLLGLLLVPLLVAAQMASRRRARRYAVRFTALPALRARGRRGAAQVDAARARRAAAAPRWRRSCSRSPSRSARSRCRSTAARSCS